MTQTATNIEQSRKLLSLGIDPETADMCYVNGRLEAFYSGCKEDMPAWSLSALCELMPKVIPDGAGKPTYVLKIQPNSFPGWTICYYSYDMDKGKFYNSNPDLFSACIDLIEQLVKQGYIKTKKV